MPTPHCSIAPAVRKPQQPALGQILLSALCLLLLWVSPAQAQPEQSALDALAALADKPSEPLASTSPACLSRCLADCPDTPNRNATQAAERMACLRVCLSGCQVYCGTVDADCALAWLGKNSGAEPVGSSLAGLCAQACTIKPNCPPPPKIIPLTPLALEAAPAQSLAPRKDETLFRPRDGSFSLLIPKGWEVSESDTRTRGGEYELRLLVPGAAGLDYVLFSLRRVSAPHRTAERFVYDLQHPRFGGAGQEASLSAATLAGLPASQPATQVETRSVRSLIGFPDQVPIVARTVVLPRNQGYFVLASEVPAALAQRYGPVLERLRQSFRIVGPQQARPQEVSAEEYAVYAAFLASDGLPGPGLRAASAQGFAEEGLAPYLRETARSRSLYSVTVAGPELTPKFEEVLFKACGAGLAPGLPEGLAQDYAHKRGQQAMVADRILLPDLRIRDANQSDGPDFGQFLSRQGAQPELMAQPGPMGRLSRRSFGDPLSVSRVAFSRDGQTALFYVRKLATSPGTTHFVLMRQREGRWELSCALMDEMRIY